MADRRGGLGRHVAWLKGRLKLGCGGRCSRVM